MTAAGGRRAQVFQHGIQLTSSAGDLLVARRQGFMGTLSQAPQSLSFVTDVTSNQ